MHEGSFPPIIQIYPTLPTGKVVQLGYIVQTSNNSYFNRRQKELLETRLHEELTDGTTAVIKGSGSALTIIGTPPDSIDGRFTLLEALHRTLNPEAPFSALGILLSSTYNVTSYVLGLQLLGSHEDAALSRIQNVLRDIAGVTSVSSVPGYSHVFQLEVAQDWRRAEDELLSELLNRGFGACLQADSTR